MDRVRLHKFLHPLFLIEEDVRFVVNITSLALECINRLVVKPVPLTRVFHSPAVRDVVASLNSFPDMIYNPT